MSYQSMLPHTYFEGCAFLFNIKSGALIILGITKFFFPEVLNLGSLILKCSIEMKLGSQYEPNSWISPLSLPLCFSSI